MESLDNNSSFVLYLKESSHWVSVVRGVCYKDRAYGPNLYIVTLLEI